MQFWKNYEKCEKYRDIKLVLRERRKYLVSEPNFHITMFFTENLLAIEIKKTQMKIILELSKILMHEFWYDYVKPKYGKMWVSL